MSSGEQPQFLDALLTRDLLVQSGVPGVYGHGAEFEDVRGGLEAWLTGQARAQGAQRLRFSPLLPRRQLESSGYLNSFPHLVGTVYAFAGDEVAAARQSQLAARHEPWGEAQQMTDLVLAPAACYPVYPALAARGPLGPEGVLIETGGAWVFRREPERDPARRQSFHMHELVRVGAADAVRAWHREWGQLAVQMLRGLGLEAELVAANDPFFGRGGRLLASHQREQSLKLEIVAPIAGPERVAVASINLHGDHFGSIFGLQLADGETAHAACVGFGHERVVLALLHRHGLDLADWPPELRQTLAC